ncbi:MAG: FecR domain-containing protein [Acidobacteria bacterium]|nr:FecR domain-containing protein [Acidobacteriota bacterium]
MKKTKRELDAIIDNVAEEIRAEAVKTTAVEDVSERVWNRLSIERVSADAGITPVERIRNCGDFQALIPSYLNGHLSSARAMLLEDHTLECVPCRKALKEARSGHAVSEAESRPARPRSRVWGSPVLRWGLAAVLIAGFGTLGTVFLQKYLRSGEPIQAVVQAADGTVFRVSGPSGGAVAAGTKIGGNEPIRTAKDARAVVRLSDGSVIEIGERSQVSLSESSRGVTIRLQQGNIIVQAAPQRARHLYVATDDCLVSVTGTIFSVNSGTKGSRVSVIEGEVHVDHGGQERVLHPGDQVATHVSIDRIPVEQEIAWSRDAERYAKILAELSVIRREIDQRVARPEIRHDSRLLDLVPEGTVLYVAIPNLSATLSEANRILEERLQQNPALREWWEKDSRATDRGPGLHRVMEQIREFGGFLGEEVVISAEMDSRGEPGSPLVLAELKDPAGFRSYLQVRLESLGREARKSPNVRMVDHPLTERIEPGSPSGRPDVFVWTQDHLLAASPKLSSLRSLAASIESPGVRRFRQRSFHASLSKVYRDGAGIIIAADLERIFAHSAANDREAAAYRQLGLTSLRHFILEAREKKGQTHHRAVLTFSEAKRGMASWLASPGPMGALDFISADANVVAAFVVQDPVALVDDLLGSLNTLDPGFAKHLTDFETASGVRIRDDIAAPLGGEFAFAVDGPVLPSPSWKMIFEVYDPLHLQEALELLVENMNGWVALQGKSGLQWNRSELDGRPLYTLRSDQGLELNYIFVDGYMIAAPSRALVERALQYRSSGYTLVRAPRFTSALPEDGNANFSALFYQNLAPVLEPLAKGLGSSAKPRHDEGREVLRSLATSAPALAYAYAQGDRILFAANSEGGPLGLSPGNLLGLPGSFGLGRILGEALR